MFEGMAGDASNGLSFPEVGESEEGEDEDSESVWERLEQRYRSLELS